MDMIIDGMRFIDDGDGIYNEANDKLSLMWGSPGYVDSADPRVVQELESLGLSSFEDMNLKDIAEHVSSIKSFKVADPIMPPDCFVEISPKPKRRTSEVEALTGGRGLDANELKYYLEKPLHTLAKDIPQKSLWERVKAIAILERLRPEILFQLSTTINLESAFIALDNLNIITSSKRNLPTGHREWAIARYLIADAISKNNGIASNLIGSYGEGWVVIKGVASDSDGKPLAIIVEFDQSKIPHFIALLPQR